MDTWNKLTVEVQLKELNDLKTFFALLLQNSFDAFVWKAVTQSLNKMILIMFICEVPNSWENGAPEDSVFCVSTMLPKQILETIGSVFPPLS